MGDSGGRMGDSVEGGLGEEIVMGGSVVGRMGDTVLWIFLNYSRNVSICKCKFESKVKCCNMQMDIPIYC